MAAGMTCASHAGAEPISADRPDFVESSEVVGRGTVQFETGFLQERSREGSVRARTRTTPMLIRMGVTDSVEARVESDGFIRARVSDTALGTTMTERGFSDASVGLKWHAQDGDPGTARPGTAWLLHLDIDSGSAPFRGQGCDLRFGGWPSGNCLMTSRSG